LNRVMSDIRRIDLNLLLALNALLEEQSVTRAAKRLALTQPQATQKIRGGESAQLSVAATGGSLHYQWYEGEPGDESKPVGLDSPFFTSEPLRESKVYWVKVSNACDAVPSQRAEVTVVAVKRRPKS